MNRRGKIFFSLVGLTLLIVAGFTVRHFLALRTLTVNYGNIDSIFIYRAADLDSNGNTDKKPLETFIQSGQQITLEKGNYVLKYDAADTYQDDFVALELSEKQQTISVSPEHSQEYIDNALDREIQNINTTIKEKYPKAGSLYEIQRGSLYQEDEWYGTTLLYKGSRKGDNFLKTDPLRIVLKKENGQWVIKTNPPNILLNKYDYPDIPEDILRNVNNLPSGQ